MKSQGILFQTKSGHPVDCSGPTLFVSIFNSSVVLGNYLQQTTSAGDISR